MPRWVTTGARPLEGLGACASSRPGRHMVFPAQDDRVLRVLRKIARGLLHYHGIETAVADNRVTVYVLRYAIPEGFHQSLRLAPQ
jgi:hypothetical protein